MSEVTTEILEQLYSPSKWSKRLDSKVIIGAHVDICTSASYITRQKAKDAEFNIKYFEDGDVASHGCKGLDIIYPEARPENHPEDLFVFVHGGYWQECNKDMYTFIGETFSSAGFTSAIVGYTLAPQAAIPEIVKECRAAIAFLIKRTKCQRIFLCGWSAGAQLINMAVNYNWSELEIDSSVFRGIICISGVFDLRPLVKTYVNKPLGMNTETASDMSPILHVNEIISSAARCLFCSVVGEYESPAFLTQTQEFSDKMSNMGVQSEWEVVGGVDHFSIIENLADRNQKVTMIIENFINNSRNTECV